MRIDLNGNISPLELNEIKTLCEHDEVTIDTSISKGNDFNNLVIAVFSDFSPVSFIRDSLISASISKVISKIANYIKEKKKQESLIQYEDIITYMGKTFYINVTCSVDQYPNIKSELDLKLTPHIKGLLPNNCVIFAEGQDDVSLKITIVEPTSGQQYIL